MSKNTATPSSSDREIMITRLLNAPRALVWEVWTQPAHIAKWWGPNGFTNTIAQMDVAPGGEWNFVMHGPDGTNYKNKSIFREVEKPSRLVFSHITGPKFDVTVTFEEEGEKTRVTMRMLFDSRKDYDTAVNTFGAVEGNKQTIARLENYLFNL